MRRNFEFGLGTTLVAHGIDGNGVPIIGMIENDGKPGEPGDTPPDGPALIQKVEAEGVILRFYSLEAIHNFLKKLELAVVAHNAFMTKKAQDSAQEPEQDTKGEAS